MNSCDSPAIIRSPWTGDPRAWQWVKANTVREDAALFTCPECGEVKMVLVSRIRDGGAEVDCVRRDGTSFSTWVKLDEWWKRVDRLRAPKLLILAEPAVADLGAQA